MSIPRFAIHRPVMMSMISAIVILIGAISLTRLPVDLLPDISQPTINVRVNYTGVGPLEMEELVTRPLEQQLSAVAAREGLWLRPLARHFWGAATRRGLVLGYAGVPEAELCRAARRMAELFEQEMQHQGR